ncbi:MAG: MoxR family ATPase [Armatimonadetes bacterium]|nr:MoxR family ATPase [Armatimonadota bacterium]
MQRTDLALATECCIRLLENVERVIVEKRRVIQYTIAALMAGGHVLFQDVAGLGKTMLARAIAVSIGGRFRRLQFTPDLLPSDVTGVTVYNQRTGQFEFRPGPVFANVLLADEINRASPRTQSALLEAMAEQQVTVDGVTYELPRPFFVLATQNPVETEGVYPLPESQLDRFMMRLRIGYPSAEAEREVVRRQLVQHPIERLGPVTTPDEVLRAQHAVAHCYVDDRIYNYAINIVRATRESPEVEVGASPRGSISLIKAAQALAVIQGRDYVTPDDIKEMAVPCLAHRLILTAEARVRGITAEYIVESLLHKVPVEV